MKKKNAIIVASVIGAVAAVCAIAGFVISCISDIGNIDFSCDDFETGE